MHSGGKMFALILLIISNSYAVEPGIMLGDLYVDASQMTFNSTLGAFKMDVETWEDGVLPLEFPLTVTAAQKKLLFDACSYWEAVAKVKCQEGDYNGRSIFISTVDSLGCFSVWGMGSAYLGFKRKMNLGKQCWDQATLIHELGHAFGLIHEHQRSDRDLYVSIQKQNVDGKFFGLNTIVNFGIQDATLFGNYDFDSIMHYSRKAFSKNGKDTIVPLKAYLQYIDTMGRVATPSSEDAYAMSSMYGSP